MSWKIMYITVIQYLIISHFPNSLKCQVKYKALHFKLFNPIALRIEKQEQIIQSRLLRLARRM